MPSVDLLAPLTILICAWLAVAGFLSLKNNRPKKRTIEATIDSKTRECMELDQYMSRLEKRSRAMNAEIDDRIKQHLLLERAFMSIDQKLNSIREQQTGSIPEKISGIGSSRPTSELSGELGNQVEEQSGSKRKNEISNESINRPRQSSNTVPDALTSGLGSWPRRPIGRTVRSAPSLLPVSAEENPGDDKRQSRKRQLDTLEKVVVDIILESELSKLESAYPAKHMEPQDSPPGLIR